ncbi:hypothetical protein [Mesorhizobium sp. M1409]
MMVYGGGIDPQTLKFDCSRCKPQTKIKCLMRPAYPESLFVGCF